MTELLTWGASVGAVLVVFSAAVELVELAVRALFNLPAKRGGDR